MEQRQKEIKVSSLKLVRDELDLIQVQLDDPKHIMRVKDLRKWASDMNYLFNAFMANVENSFKNILVMINDIIVSFSLPTQDLPRGTEGMYV